MAKLKATSVDGNLTVTGSVTSTVAGATTSKAGTVKLNSSTNSTLETEAATPKAVKAAYDRYPGAASVNASGIVKLNNTTNSTSTTEAATAAAVKAAYDKGNHSHPYLSTSGGTVSGLIKKTGSGLGFVIAHGTSRTGVCASSTAGEHIFGGNNSGDDVNIVDYIRVGKDKLQYTTGGKSYNILHSGVSHGNHVPTTETASNGKFLRNDNKWATPNPDLIGAAKGSGYTGSTGAKAGWYRIAQTGNSVGNVNGLFVVKASVSGSHSTSILSVGISFSSAPTLQQLSHTAFGSSGITQARIVYPDSYSGNKAYLEVYVPTDHARSMEVQLIGLTGWILLEPSTLGTVPTGFKEQAITLLTHRIVANIQGTVNGHTVSKSVPENAVFTDTKYNNATTSASGLMSNTDKSKLDGIASGANNYTHPTGNGNNHIPSNGAANQYLKYSAAGTAVWSGLPGASTSAQGIVQLNNTTSSTSTSEAATAAAVKAAYDKANHSHLTLNGTYISGGNEKPNYFGANNLKLQMLQGIGTGWGWCDTLWMSSYSGGDVKGSNQLVFSKVGDRIGFRRQNFDSTSWGTTHEIYHTGNKPSSQDLGFTELMSEKSTGWTKLPNGLIIQWGYVVVSVPSNGWGQTVGSLPIKFPNKQYVVVGTSNWNQSLGSRAYLDVSIDRVVMDGTGGVLGIARNAITPQGATYKFELHYIALGY